jgi:hypothetical protein
VAIDQATGAKKVADDALTAARALPDDKIATPTVTTTAVSVNG